MNFSRFYQSVLRNPAAGNSKRRIFSKFVLKCGRWKIEALNFKKFTLWRFFESLLKIGFKTRWSVEKYGCRKSKKTNFSKFTQNRLQNAVAGKLKLWIFLTFVLKCDRVKIKVLNFEKFTERRIFQNLLKIGFKTRWPIKKYGTGKIKTMNFSKFTQNWFQNAAAGKSERWIFLKIHFKMW